jgi:serine/threonine protein kinase
MGYMKGGSLTDVVTANLMTQGQIAAVSRETCQGPEHLHRHGFIHCDIKLGNVLLSLTGDIKLSACRAAALSHPLTPARSGLRFLRADLRGEREADDDARDTVLDGAGGHDAQGLWAQGRHRVARRHGDQDDRGRPVVPEPDPLKVLYFIATNGTPAIANPAALSSTFRDYLVRTSEVDAERRPDATQALQVRASARSARAAADAFACSTRVSSCSSRSARSRRSSRPRATSQSRRQVGMQDLLEYAAVILDQRAAGTPPQGRCRRRLAAVQPQAPPPGFNKPLPPPVRCRHCRPHPHQCP